MPGYLADTGTLPGRVQETVLSQMADLIQKSLSPKTPIATAPLTSILLQPFTETFQNCNLSEYLRESFPVITVNFPIATQIF